MTSPRGGREGTPAEPAGRAAPGVLARSVGRGTSAASAGPAALSALGRPAALAALLGGSVFVAATPVLAAYRVAGAAVLVVAASGGSVLVSLVATRVLRLRPFSSYGLSLVGLLGLLLCADGPHPSAVLRGMTEGPNRLLTETLPLGGDRASLSAVIALVWLCGAAVGEISGRRPEGGRFGPALAVPVLLYLVCFAAASPAPTHDRFAAPLLLVCLAAAAVVGHQGASASTVRADGDEGSDPAGGADARLGPLAGLAARARGPLTGIGSAAVLGLALAVTVPSAPGLPAHAAVLHRRPPTVVPVITDPVDSMGQLRDANPASGAISELLVTLSRPSTGYLAMAYLDSFDGGQWRFSAAFEPTGGRVPAAGEGTGVGEGAGAGPARPVAAPAQISQRIEVTGALPVPLLPAIDRPSRVGGLQVVADPATGMLLPQSPRTHPDYSVVSAGTDATILDVSPAAGLGPSPDAADLALPPGTGTYLATMVRFLSALGVGHPAANVAFLQETLRALRTMEKRVDPTLSPSSTGASSTGASDRGSPDRLAPGTVTGRTPPVAVGGGGTSLSEVINAVTVDRTATPEQFATFFALVARYLNVPARMVTGFRLAGGSASGRVPAGAYRVTNRQAWAWVEVPVQGHGWLVCDPTPVATGAPGAQPPQSVSSPPTTAPPLQANAVPRNQGTGGHALAPPGHARPVPVSPWSPSVIAVLGLSAALVAALLTGPGQAGLRRAVRRRRRRRRAADPAGLAVGAWLELLDALERAGMRPAAGATSSELAEDVGHHFSADLVPAAAAVAAVADRAVFSTRSAITVEVAAQTWASSQRIRRQVMRYLDTRQRIRSSCSVGSAPSRPEEVSRR